MFFWSCMPTQTDKRVCFRKPGTPALELKCYDAMGLQGAPFWLHNKFGFYVICCLLTSADGWIPIDFFLWCLWVVIKMRLLGVYTSHLHLFINSNIKALVMWHPVQTVWLQLGLLRDNFQMMLDASARISYCVISIFPQLLPAHLWFLMPLYPDSSLLVYAELKGLDMIESFY